MMSRKTAIEVIRLDYAQHGKDTGTATKAFLNNRISLKAYQKAGAIGLSQYKARV